MICEVLGQGRRLDDVVVDADEDEIFRAHPAPPGLVVPRLYIRAEYNTGRSILAEEILGGPGQRV